MSIDAKVISPVQEIRAIWVCENWPGILADCRNFIEAQRSNYGLHAKQFQDPGVFLREDHEWTVSFGAESESEAIDGVGFRGSKPFRLSVGS